MSLSGLLNQTITLYGKAGLDKYGRENYGVSSSVKCRFQKKTSTRLLPNGQVKVIEATVYLPATTTINVGDKVTYQTIDYKVYGRYDAIDGTGATNHIKVELTKWA
jgi:plastocyanin